MSGFEEMLRDVLFEMLHRRALAVLHPETQRPLSEQDITQACQAGGRLVISFVSPDCQAERLRELLVEMLRRHALVVLHPKTGGPLSEQDIAQASQAGGQLVVSLVPAGCQKNVRYMQRMVRLVELGIVTAEELPDFLEPALHLVAYAMASDWVSAIREALSHLAELNAGGPTALTDCRKAEAVQQVRALVEAPLARCDTARGKIRRTREALWNAWHEYACVCCMTSQPKLMLEANETRVSEQDAVALLNLLSEHYACPLPKVTWGRGRRAWARSKEHRIHLPRAGRRLNVGTVLHELAHLMAPPGDPAGPSGRRRVHGPEFAKALDRLLVVSSPAWMNGKFNYEQTMWLIMTTHEGLKMKGRARREYRRREYHHEHQRQE